MTNPNLQHKQERIQETLHFGGKFSLFATVCVLGIVGSLATARGQEKMMPRSGDQMATLRLVAAAGQRKGTYTAGVDLTMIPGSHTYWKNPGEAGVPPVFSFNGSVNVKSADVLYPTPERITEEGLDAFGYYGRVVFPVAVVAQDPAKPSELHLDVTYAVCNHICLPGHGDAVLELRPNGPGTSPEVVEAALKTVPRASSAEALAVSADTGKDPVWMLTWSGARPLTDIYPSAPEGFYFATKKAGPNRWTLRAEQSVAITNATHVDVGLVLASPDGALQTTRSFTLPPKVVTGSTSAN